MVRKNLIANFLGQGWSALMSFAFVPVYIKYLGLEAYGLIGLFALMQSWLSLLDVGMTPTLGREMARFSGGGQPIQSIRDLLRTFELITAGIAFLIAGGVSFGSNWMATHWIQAKELSTPVVSQAFAIMGLVLALRFVEGIYRSSIVGLQKQVLFNTINSGLATLRAVGVVAILIWVSPTIKAYFQWHAVISIVSIFILGAYTYSSLPSAQRPSKFSLIALKRVWRFASGMLTITILALLLTQVDKILLSNLLPLSTFGQYALASTLATVVFVVINPISQAIYPRLCEFNAVNDQAKLIHSYHQGAQLVTVFAGTISIILVMFGEPILRIWTHDPVLSHDVAPLLGLLALGNLLNGLNWIPYQAQLAFGITKLAVVINIIAVAIIVPAIIIVTPRFGALGAAWVWIGLNSAYTLIGVQFMYNRILVFEKNKWYAMDLFLPLGVIIIAASVFKLAWPLFGNSTLIQIPYLVISFLTILTTGLLAAGDIRKHITSFAVRDHTS